MVSVTWKKKLSRGYFPSLKFSCEVTCLNLKFKHPNNVDDNDSDD